MFLNLFWRNSASLMHGSYQKFEGIKGLFSWQGLSSILFLGFTFYTAFQYSVLFRAKCLQKLSKAVLHGLHSVLIFSICETAPEESAFVAKATWVQQWQVLRALEVSQFWQPYGPTYANWYILHQQLPQTTCSLLKNSLLDFSCVLRACSI